MRVKKVDGLLRKANIQRSEKPGYIQREHMRVGMRWIGVNFKEQTEQTSVERKKENTKPACAAQRH